MARSRPPDSSIAYIDSKGQRRVRINGASHVINNDGPVGAVA